MTRCCVCRMADDNTHGDVLEPTWMPGSGLRCVDREACRQRVIAIVSAHTGLAEALR